MSRDMLAVSARPCDVARRWGFSGPTRIRSRRASLRPEGDHRVPVSAGLARAASGAEARAPMNALTRALAGSSARSFDSVQSFFAWHQADAASFDRPIDRAILGGAGADRLGYAFAAGYAAALQALVPGLG